MPLSIPSQTFRIPFNTLWITAVLALIVLSCSAPAEQAEGSGELHYTEAYRPQFHFSPDSMWMNDPNGMVYYQGEYHLFYQHHPHSNVWGPMHWGHAVSRDLVRWEHLPIALYPDSLGTIFSGSAVMDWYNTSGLGSAEQPPMVAVFTQHSHELEGQGSDLYQTQGIAWSLDRGRTWTKYEGNPVIPNPGIRDFRDPKVSWYEEGQKWIMVLAAWDRILFYSSPDLLHWSRESEFTAPRGPEEGVWECPDLFSLRYGEEERWVLLVSIGSGGPNGGSGTKYYVGDFDGRSFSCADPACGERWVDFGKDNYAGVTWSDVPEADGRRIFMGWMSNWQYATAVPTERWRSAMTLPRELKLDRDSRGYLLRSVPVVETEQLRADHVTLEPGPVEGPFPSHAGPDPGEDYPLFEIDLTFAYDATPADQEVTGGDLPAAGLEFGIILQGAGQETLVMAFNTATQTVRVDRQESGQTAFSTEFPGVHPAPYPAPRKGEMRFHAFVDLSSVELFVDGGALVMTELAFPESGFHTILPYASQGSVQLKQGVIHRLRRTW